MARIVILGAGPTGLSAAYHLEKQGFYDYKLFEKEKTIGGLCRSITEDGYTFDFTGHLLHLNDEYVRSVIDSVADLTNFNTIKRRSYIYSHNTYTKYPFQCNLYGLPSEVIAECIDGYATRKKSRKKVSSFHDWVLRSFGRGFGEHFFFPYQEKIFSYDIKKITATWTGRFVPSTSLKTIINGALTENTAEIGYNAHFYYPRSGGIQFWLDGLARQLKNDPLCDYEAKVVDLNKKTITFSGGHEEQFEQLITTMPLDTLLHKTNEPASSNVKTAAHKLRCNSVININLGIARPDISEKHWIYFPEKKFPFYRIGFYHNFSKELAPKGAGSLYAEFSYLKNKRSTLNQQVNLARAALHDLLSLKSQDIAVEKILDISHAYVIFNQWRDQNIHKLLNHLASRYVHSVGRYGAWKYASMQEAVLDGKKIAEKLVGGL